MPNKYQTYKYNPQGGQPPCIIFFNNMNKLHYYRTTINRVPKDFGQSIEETVRQAIATNQPLDGKAPEIFTEAAKGVLPEFDIRTDKQDLALMANDKYQASERMRGFINQIETDKDGWDGNGEKPKVEPEQNE